MLYWVIQITIISLVIIVLVHNIINFFKSMLTVPKIKDLVNSPSQKYENMYNIINNNNNDIKHQPITINATPTNEYTLIDLLPTKEEPDMKNELKTFLKNQLHTENAFDSITPYE
jgi:hypothetical protein